MNKVFSHVALPILALTLGACGAKKGDVNVNLVSTAALSVTGFEGALKKMDFIPFSNTYTFLTAGTDSGLISYKVYFRSIQLCEDLTTSGTGYTGASGCANLYTNETDEYTGTLDPTAADVERFNAAGTGKYYDLLSPTDLAALKAAMATSIEPRNYNWGLMETHPWVKIKAKSGTFCTKSGGTLKGSGQFQSYMEVASLDCGSGGAEDALVYMVNGNSSFKFNTALSVTADAAVRADIVFNLDDTVSLVTGASSTGGLRNAASTAAFNVPFFAASPAVLGADQKLVKESYEFALSSITGATITGSPKFYVDLYYASADTTKTPFAVTGGLVRTDSSSKGRSEKFDEIVLESGNVKLGDWEGKFPITFARTAAGASSTGSLTCSATAGYLASCAANSTANMTATLTDSNGPTLTEL